MNRTLETAALKALLDETKEVLSALCIAKRNAKNRLTEINNRLEAIRYEEKEAA